MEGRIDCGKKSTERAGVGSERFRANGERCRGRGVRTLRACTKCRLRCISSSSKVMCAGSASSSSTEGEGEGEVLQEAEWESGWRGDPVRGAVAIPMVGDRRQTHPEPRPANKKTQSSSNKEAEIGREEERRGQTEHSRTL